MLAILSIIIGIVFVLLLFSMLTSAVVEVYHAANSSRGKHLRNTLEIMLGKDVCDKFYDHSYFRQLSSASKPLSKLKLPIWVEKGTFSNILADILSPRNSNLSVPERINLIENADFRKVLDFLWRQSGGDIAVFQKKVEDWFDDVMARAKDWFADHTKWRLFFFGTLLAAVLNADTIQIYQSLSANAALRDEIVGAAEKFSISADTARIRPINAPPRDSATAKANYDSIRTTYIETIQSPLGLGWGQSQPANWWEWLSKIAGWLLTGVAVTMGAPFWFEMLRKLLALKGSSSGDSDKSIANSSGGKTETKPVTSFEMKSAGSDRTDAPVG
ncbi:MAG: hypothetical protein H7246_11100 [Phycisphaerae bacterium]|nr:hypothetical protein [Saprospiraceae bacterium]